MLAQGAPQRGQPRWPRAAVFVAEPRAGQTPRALQARLLDEPDVIDAVPEGGRVRFVRRRPTARRRSAPAPMRSRALA